MYKTKVIIIKRWESVTLYMPLDFKTMRSPAVAFLSSVWGC